VSIGGPPARAKAKAKKPPREPRAKAQTPPCDPKLVSAARELRDRYLEQVNTADAANETPLLPAGKYDVARQFAPPPAAPSIAQSFTPAPPKQLPQAA